MNPVWALLIVLVATAIAIAAMLFVRARAPEGSFFEDGDRASGVFGVLATGFAVLLGLVVVLAFTSYDESRAGAEVEALTLLQQAETTQFMPTEIRGRLSDQLVCYGRTVVEQQWPALEEGTLSEAFNPWGVAMYNTLRATTADTGAEQSAVDRWFDQTSAREAATNDRIHGAEGVIPTQLWLVLFLMAAIILAYVLFFADSGERRVVQAMLMGSVAAVLTLTLLLISSLDDPYKNTPGGLQPVAMERTLRLMDQQRRVVGIDGRSLPCDASGRRI